MRGASFTICTRRATPVTTEALRKISELYVIEAEVRGKPPDERPQARQARSHPLLNDLERWLRTTLDTLSRKSDTAAAICNRNADLTLTRVVRKW